LDHNGLGLNECRHGLFQLSIAMLFRACHVFLSPAIFLASL
jgi:hypothetical protein